MIARQKKTNVPTSPSQWRSWIAAELESHAETYERQPKRLIADFNRERRITTDYKGRELLELLQNANDAAAEAQIESKVFVELTAQGICFANTGAPFTTAGVQSLMISDFSPKRQQNVYVIGNKGLGLRSILNWSECPFIISGRLSIGYDSRHSAEWLKEVCKRSPALGEHVEAERGRTGVDPIPRFLVPHFVEQGTVAETHTENPNFLPVWSSARKLRRKGYDTVVGIPFTDDEGWCLAKEQIARLPPEVLFLAGNLGRITIDTEGARTEWRCSVAHDISGGKADRVTLNTEKDGPGRTWKRWKKDGRVPDKILESKYIERLYFEFVVAVPQENTGVPDKLFNYFPTQVSFPWSFLCHATVDLTTNRQHIQDTPVNRYLVKELAEFIVDVAGEHVSSDQPWGALSLLSKAGQPDSVLMELGFFDAIIAAAKTKPLIPVLGGSFATPDTACKMPVEYGDWLPAEAFQDAALPTLDIWIRQFLDDLGIKTLAKEEIVQRIDAVAPGLSIDQRAALLADLVNEHALPKDLAPALLTNTAGELIPHGTPTFLPPGRRRMPKLPEWAGLEILHPAFLRRLKLGLDEGDTQKLVFRLPNCLRVKRHSLGQIAPALREAANRAVQKDRKREKRIRTELLQILYDLFEAQPKTRRRDSGIPGVKNIYVPVSNGGFREADSVYFSEDYLPTGSIVAALYRGVDDGKMLARSARLGLSGDAGSVRNFLGWLGVADWPRTHTMVHSVGDYLSVVKDGLPNPIRFDDDTERYEQNELGAAQLEDVTTIDGLEGILETAEGEAIVAWLALDHRRSDLLREMDNGAVFSAYPTSKQKRRHLRQSFPNYVPWLFANREWLPSQLGDRRRPGECFLGRTQRHKLERLLPRPRIDYRIHELFQKNDITEQQIARALADVGVPASYDSLSWERFYDLLLKLPDVDPEGKAAKTLYRNLLEGRGSAEPNTPPKGLIRRFEEYGRLWGALGDEKRYFPVKELRYVDREPLPGTLAKEIALVEIDQRRGARRIRELFGVEPIRTDSFSLRVTKTKPSNLAAELSKELDRLKPFVYAFTIGSDTSGASANRLRARKIELCTEVRGTALLGRKSQRFVLEPGHWIREGDLYYMACNPHLEPPVLGDFKIARVVGEILSDIVGGEHEDHFREIAKACPAERQEILEYLLGPDASELVATAREALQTEDDVKDPTLIFIPETGDQDQRDGRVVGPVEDEPAKATERLPDTEGGQDKPRAVPIGSLVVIEKIHDPKPPRQKIEFRVRARPKKQRTDDVTVNKARRITDGDRCEELAETFERSPDQKRYPIRVGHIQGYTGPRCDVVSFTSKKSLNEFKKTGEPRLVGRFIEVKGRSTRDAVISLKGNEKDAALDYADKYYLYRMFDSENGSIDLLIVQDPMAQHEALTWVAEIDPLRAKKARQFVLEPVKRRPRRKKRASKKEPRT